MSWQNTPPIQEGAGSSLNLPIHSTLYASDLEQQQEQSLGYPQSHGYNFVSPSQSYYAAHGQPYSTNGAFAPQQYYVDYGHGNQYHQPPLPSTMYAFPPNLTPYQPGMPIQNPQDEVSFTSASQDVMHQGNELPQDFHFPQHKRGRERPFRGKGRGSRPFNDRGGRQGHRNYNNPSGAAYRDYSEGDYYEKDYDTGRKVFYSRDRGRGAYYNYFRGHKDFSGFREQNLNSYRQEKVEFGSSDNTKISQNQSGASARPASSKHEKETRTKISSNNGQWDSTEQKPLAVSSTERITDRKPSGKGSGKLRPNSNSKEEEETDDREGGIVKDKGRSTSGVQSSLGKENRRRNHVDTKGGRGGLSGKEMRSRARQSMNQISVTKDESQRGALTEQLSKGKYECMVCCDNIRVETAVWSCENCYHVFHLYCIKKWVQSSLDQETISWRCPGCQNVSTSMPTQYRCFCGKHKDPVFVRGETPHSCGEACKKRRRVECRHPCTILCHPGPCPPCSSTVNQACDCGRIKKNMLCSMAKAFKCDQVCGKLLNCSEHKCDFVCHSGPCQACQKFTMQECFCRKTTRKVMCGTQEFQTTSFSCDKTCQRILTCGNHVCEEVCHPGECAPCALTPGTLQHCCCGKTPISELELPERQTCLDTLPTCSQTCSKPMACGSPGFPHLCDRKCHEGDCGPCKQETRMKCECRAIEKDIPCEVAVTFNAQNPFKCQRRCGKKKICGKHKCSENCCVKDIHICEIVCGKKLSCGLHRCEELCHKGNCKRCLQASFDELMCHCGAEVIEPPVPCGSKLPVCHRPCNRQHNCDHPVRHNCHADEQCPPCTDLTEKMCMGGHVLRKNIPCHMTDISCGMPCDKPMPCGQHKCQRKCHKGDCLENGAECTQQCTKRREACDHPCGAPCHSGPCPQTVCKSEITITCPCGNKSAKATCGVGKDKALEQFQRLNVQSLAQSGGQSVDMAQFSLSRKSNKRLDCDTNCAILERNKRLALALEIKNPDMNAKLGNPTFTDFVKDFAKKNPRFALNVEQKVKELVQSAKQSTQASKSHAFPPMNRDQRRFVHEMGEFFGCQTQSYDYEPNKNVVVTANKEKCWLPNGSLGQHVLKDHLPKGLTSLTSMKAQGVSFTLMEKRNSPPPQKETSSSSRGWEHGNASAWGGAGNMSQPVAKAAETTIDYFDFSTN